MEGCPAGLGILWPTLGPFDDALAGTPIRLDFLLGGREARVAALITDNLQAADLIGTWSRVDHRAITNRVVNGPVVLGNEAKVRRGISSFLRSRAGAGKCWPR
jgi:hypothetical protein